MVWMVFYVNRPTDSPIQYKRTLIIGAGAAGTLVARHLKNNKETILKPVVFLDDSPKKQKLQYYGISVVGKIEDVEKVVDKYNISHIIIAIPTLSRREMNHVLNVCSRTKIRTQMIPKIEDLMSGRLAVNQFRDVDVDDLLGRNPVQLDRRLITSHICGKSILVTGAGGSIGSELCRQVMSFHPKEIVLVGQGENSIYNIHMELNAQLDPDKTKIFPVIANIKDRERIFEVVQQYKPDIIYHAAAHKHVPLMEANPLEAIKNNIIGTKNVADAADSFQVKTFVCISTDKAVEPSSIMGATKRIAEKIVHSLNEKSKTKFVAVRFGNVLGSRGSVVPLFKKQIQEGGPVTVTHPEMTRYFMTIKEASQLVIQAGTLAEGGEIFVLDMGKPVKILDLAKNLIHLSGFSLHEIGIVFTGIRPGEKLHEQLQSKNDENLEEVFPKINRVRTTYPPTCMEETENLLQLSMEEIQQELEKMIEQFRVNHQNK